MPRTRKKPKLLPVSKDMQRVFALLAEEVAAWPDVSTKLMFGFRAVYRKGVIFAMLPDKRSLEVEDSLAYKQDGIWKSFVLKSDEGIREAIAVLERAYMRQ